MEAVALPYRAQLDVTMRECKIVNNTGFEVAVYTLESQTRKHKMWRRSRALPEYFQDFALIDAIARYHISRETKGSKPIFFQDEILPLAGLTEVEHGLMRTNARILFKTSHKPDMVSVIVNDRPKLMRRECRQEQAKVYVHINASTGTVNQVYINTSETRDVAKFVPMGTGSQFVVHQGRLNQLRNYIVTLSDRVPGSRADKGCASFRNCARHQCITLNCEGNLRKILQTRGMNVIDLSLPQTSLAPYYVNKQAGLAGAFEPLKPLVTGAPLLTPAPLAPPPSGASSSSFRLVGLPAKNDHSFTVVFPHLNFEERKEWFASQLLKMSPLRISVIVGDASPRQTYANPNVHCILGPGSVIMKVVYDSTIKDEALKIPGTLQTAGSAAFSGVNFTFQLYAFPQNGFVKQLMPEEPSDGYEVVNDACEEQTFYLSELPIDKSSEIFVKVSEAGPAAPLAQNLARCAQTSAKAFEWYEGCDLYPKHVVLESSAGKVWRPVPFVDAYLVKMVRKIARSKEQRRMLVDLEVHSRRTATLNLLAMICGCRGGTEEWVVGFGGNTEPKILCTDAEAKLLEELAQMYPWSNSLKYTVSSFLMGNRTDSINNGKPTIVIYDPSLKIDDRSTSAPLIVCTSDLSTAIAMHKKKAFGKIAFSGSPVHSNVWTTKVKLETVAIRCTDTHKFREKLADKVREKFGATPSGVVVHSDDGKFKGDTLSLGDATKLNIQALDAIVENSLDPCKYIVSINPSMATLTRLYSTFVAPNYKSPHKLHIILALQLESGEAMHSSPFFTSATEFAAFKKAASVTHNLPKDAANSSTTLQCAEDARAVPTSSINDLDGEISWYTDVAEVMNMTDDKINQLFTDPQNTFPFFRGMGPKEINADVKIEHCDPFAQGKTWYAYEASDEFRLTDADKCDPEQGRWWELVG